MRTRYVAGLATGLFLLFAQGATPTGAQEERPSPVPFASEGVSPDAPPMPEPGGQLLSGNFAGDDRDELLYFNAGSVGETMVSFSNEGTAGSALSWQTFRYTVNGYYTPVVGDFDGNGHDDILWYGLGTNRDFLWEFTSFTAVTSTEIVVNGYYGSPVAGDFTADGTDDIVWYDRGSGQDFLWELDPGGQHTTVPLRIDGYYQPIVGSFGQDASDDVLWYAVGPSADNLWDFAAQTAPVAYSSRPLPVNGYYVPVSLDAWNDGAGGSDIWWVTLGADAIWDFTGGVLRRTRDFYDPDVAGIPTAGDFLGDGNDDIVWTTSESVVLWEQAANPSYPPQVDRWIYRIQVG